MAMHRFIEDLLQILQVDVDFDDFDTVTTADKIEAYHNNVCTIGHDNDNDNNGDNNSSNKVELRVVRLVSDTARVFNKYRPEQYRHNCRSSSKSTSTSVKKYDHRWSTNSNSTQLNINKRSTSTTTNNNSRNNNRSNLRRGKSDSCLIVPKRSWQPTSTPKPMSDSCLIFPKRTQSYNNSNSITTGENLNNNDNNKMMRNSSKVIHQHNNADKMKQAIIADEAVSPTTTTSERIVTPSSFDVPSSPPPSPSPLPLPLPSPSPSSLKAAKTAVAKKPIRGMHKIDSIDLNKIAIARYKSNRKSPTTSPSPSSTSDHNFSWYSSTTSSSSSSNNKNGTKIHSRINKVIPSSLVQIQPPPMLLSSTLTSTSRSTTISNKNDSNILLSLAASSDEKHNMNRSRKSAGTNSLLHALGDMASTTRIKLKNSNNNEQSSGK
jgi:hypothetical protein